MKFLRIKNIILSFPKFYEFVQSGFIRQKHTRLMQAMNLIYLPTPCRVLDIGCGTGQAAPLFSEQKRFCYTGIDLSEKYIRRASQKFPTMKFYKADICRDVIDQSGFDLVLIDAVLHHIEDRSVQNVLFNLLNNLNEPGYLIVHDMFSSDYRGIKEMLPFLITRFDRGDYCRGYEPLLRLIRNYFIVENQMTYNLNLMGLKFCNMAIFICKPIFSSTSRY